MEGFADGVVAEDAAAASRVAGAAGDRGGGVAVGQQSDVLGAVAEQEAEGKEENQVGQAGRQGGYFPTPTLDDAVHGGDDKEAAQRGYGGEDGDGKGAAAAEPLVDAGEHGVLKGDAVAEGDEEQIDEGKGPEAAEVLGKEVEAEQGEVANYRQQHGGNEQSAVAELVDEPAGEGAFEAAFGPGQGENEVGLGLADA